VDGYKHVLGIWLAASEGARFWAGVLAELRNRGIKDVLFVCCDGLSGLPGAIGATWNRAKVQTCVIHLIRASMRYVSRKDRKKASAAMRPIYTALNEAAAKTALENLRRDFGKKSPGLVAAWDRAWAGSSGALPRRSPLRTGRASCPRIRLKQARGCHGQKDWHAGARGGARPCERNRCAGAVRRRVHPAMRGAGQR
jgi:Transposase, Mutator family